MGLIIIIATVTLLLRNKTSPIVAMSLVPVAGALIAGYGLGEISEFFSEGLSSVMNVVVMFIFAIVFFGILQDTGLFTPVVTALIRSTRGNIVLVAVGTALIGIVAHLDGAGATTFLLTIPALLPLYKALHMSRYVLLCIVATAASVMNMVPWAGPVGRASSVIALEPTEIWHHILPIQGIAIVLVLVLAVALGLREQRRVAKLRATGALDEHPAVDVHSLSEEFVAQQNAERAELGITFRTGKWVTVSTVVVALVLLVTLLAGWLPPGPAFLIATSVVLTINCADAASQRDIIKRHAPSALAMAGVIIAAAMFLGVLDGTGMLEAIALSLLQVLPESVGPWLHVAVGLLGVPLDLATSTDAYYFSVLPIVQETAASFGISGLGAASALIIGNIIGTFVSPFSPALWLAIGLARAEMGKHLKLSFPIAWGVSAVLVLIALAMGLLA